MKEEKIFKPLQEFMEDFYKTAYGSKYLNYPELKKQKDNKLIEEWFKEVYDYAKDGGFISNDILEEVWKLSNSRFYGPYYRLFHDIPNIRVDLYWIHPDCRNLPDDVHG